MIITTIIMNSNINTSMKKHQAVNYAVEYPMNMMNYFALGLMILEANMLRLNHWTKLSCSTTITICAPGGTGTAPRGRLRWQDIIRTP